MYSLSQCQCQYLIIVGISGISPNKEQVCFQLAASIAFWLTNLRVSTFFFNDAYSQILKVQKNMLQNDLNMLKTSVGYLLNQMFESIFEYKYQKNYQKQYDPYLSLLCVYIFLFYWNWKRLHIAVKSWKLKIENCISHSSFLMYCWKHTYYYHFNLRVWFWTHILD